MGAPISTAAPQQQPTGKGGGQQPRFGQPNQYANTVGDAQYRPQQNSMMPQAQYIGAPNWMDQAPQYPANAGPQTTMELPQNGMMTGYGGNNGMMNQPNVIPQGGWDNAGSQLGRQSTGKGGKGQSSWQPFQSNSNWNQ